MMQRLRFLWHRHRVPVIAFAVAAALTLGLGLRAVLFTVYWSDPAHRARAVEPWMTPRYIVHAWKIPPETLREALGEPDMPVRRRTLEEIAEAHDVPVADLVDAVEAALRRAGAK